MDTGRTGGGQFKSGWSSACARAGLRGEWRVWTAKGKSKPRRFFVPEATPYATRHAWATWQYCLHRDLLRLKADGGWSTVTMVARYAKVLPDAHRAEVEAWYAGA